YCLAATSVGLEHRTFVVEPDERSDGQRGRNPPQVRLDTPLSAPIGAPSQTEAAPTATPDKAFPAPDGANCREGYYAAGFDPSSQSTFRQDCGRAGPHGARRCVVQDW